MNTIATSDILDLMQQPVRVQIMVRNKEKSIAGILLMYDPRNNNIAIGQATKVQLIFGSCIVHLEPDFYNDDDDAMQACRQVVQRMDELQDSFQLIK